MPARFYELKESSGLKNKRKLSLFLDNKALEHFPEKKMRLQYIFCDDEYLLDINRKFLKHDTFTDIVTFDLSDQEAEIAGEIYISLERVKENAQKFGVEYKEELHRVIFHGALHLLGFKDKTATDKKQMRTQEDNCIKEYFKDGNK